MRPSHDLHGPVGRFRTTTAVVACLLVSLVPCMAQEEPCGYAEHLLDPESVDGALTVQAGDVDLDGDTDMVVGSINDGSISWLENDGAGSFTRRVVSDLASGITDLFLVDLDGEGDLDVLAALASANRVIWYENYENQGARAFVPRLLSGVSDHPVSVYAIDLDGDGDIDVLSASFVDQTIAWYENRLIPENEGFVRHVITDAAPGASSVFAADLDNDGRNDVIAASTFDDSIRWFRNEEDAEGAITWNGEGGVLSAGAIGAKWVHAADLNDDGYPDILAASVGDDTIAWFENPYADKDSLPTFTMHVIDSAAGGAKMVLAGVFVDNPSTGTEVDTDFDGDGDRDVLAVLEHDNAVVWYENRLVPDGEVTFVRRVVASDRTSVDAAVPAYFDADGRTTVDVVAVASVPDGAPDDDVIAWYENDLPTEGDFAEHVLGTGSRGARALVRADLDGDANEDFVSAGDGSELSWYENDGGEAPAFTRTVISTEADGATMIRAANMDFDPAAEPGTGDLDNDLLVVFPDDDTVAWFENRLDEGMTVFTRHDITTTAEGAQSVWPADLNGDGRMDVIVASRTDGKVAWHENDPDAPGGFVEHVVTADDEELSDLHTLEARAAVAIDVNADGLLDIASASSGDGRIAWYPNAGAGIATEDERFVEQFILASDDTEESDEQIPGTRDLYVADIAVDAEGDPVDELIWLTSAGRVGWFDFALDAAEESGVAATLNLVAVNLFNPVSLSVGDVNLDGFLDLLVASRGDSIARWYENDGADEPTFSSRRVATTVDLPAALAVGESTGNDLAYLLIAFQGRMAWYQPIVELCRGFDATGDDVIDGAELAWIARAFGRLVLGGDEWWSAVDYNGDGQIDGEDLAILVTTGVWGFSPDDCTYTCP